jgi:type IV secretory pathway TrbD component
VAQIFLKVIVVILVPLIELFLLGPADIFHPKIRKIVILSGALIQIIILGVLILIAWNQGGELWEQTIVELPVVLIGAVSTALVLYIKRNPKPTEVAAAQKPIVEPPVEATKDK